MYKKIFNLYPNEKLLSQNLTQKNKTIILNKEKEKEMSKFINNLIKLKFNKVPTFYCGSN